MAEDRILNALVVDDEADITFLLSTVLEFNRFKVTVLHKGAEAVELLRKNTYDLVIVDYMMEGMDGIQVIQEIRHTLNLKDLKVILLTFKDLEPKELNVITNENICYLKKPFLPNELILKIESLFG